MSVKSASIRSTPTRKRRTSSRKNIREAYIDYVKQNSSLKKSQSISNLDNCDVKATTSSSNYLEDQYSLVKRILNASTALEKLEKSARGVNINNGDIKSSRSVTSGTPLYKTQEEYYDEVMMLKKKLKHLEKNETITKAKLDYYENELTKKYQEIEVLLDSKSGDKFASLKSDYRQTVSLKKKIHKLEMKLREKDSKLQKLESDLKTTDIRELRITNEIMKQEIQRLNECLIKGNYQNLLSDRDTNRSNFFLNSNSKDNLGGKNAFEIEIKALKDENQRLIERLQNVMNEKNNEGNVSQLRKINEEYRNEIERLKNGHKNKKDNSDDSSSSSIRDSKSPTPSKAGSIKDSLASLVTDSIKRKPSPSTNREKSELPNAVINTLVSVFRGHAERLKFNNENVEDKKVNKDPIKKDLMEHKKSDPSPSRNKIESPSLSRHNSTESLSRGRDTKPKNVAELNSILNSSFKKSNKSFNDDDELSMD